MKRALVLVVVALLGLSALAVCGPYFEVETNPLNLETGIVLGWDGNFGVWSDESSQGLGVGWDLFAEFTTQTQSVTLGGTVSLTGDIFGLDFGVVSIYDYSGWSNIIVLDSWTCSVGLDFYVSKVVTIWGAIDMTYAPNALWVIAPMVGISCHW